jgi:hypothetical protein
MTMSTIDKAENQLREELVRTFGQKLRGVISFGRRWDPRSDRENLGVVLDKSVVSNTQASALPDSIGGVAVKVMRGGPAFLD